MGHAIINAMEKTYIVGIDEVGRGPLAGPVTLAACAFPIDFKLPDFDFKIKDSKKMSEERRKEVYKVLYNLKREGKINFSLSSVSHDLIDKYGLSACIKLAIKRCLVKLEIESGNAKIFLDGGLYAPIEYVNQMTIVKGDEKEEVIALASIIAKVCRDSVMCNLSKKYPEYGFHIHKGYGTKAHYEALEKYGPCEIHRRSFLK